MYLENRVNQPGRTVPGYPVYTVYPATDHQQNVNYAFPQAPPPKYEDVISGTYLNPDYRIYENQPTDGIHHSTSPPSAPLAQVWSTPPNMEAPKNNTYKGAGAILFFVLILTLILIFRVCIKMN